MNFLTMMSSITNHPLITFVTVVAIGLVWIYFQLPKIKAGESLPNGMVSSRDEWIDAKKAFNKYSFILFSLGLVFVYGVWIYTPDINDEFDYIAYFLKGMTAICFTSVAGMQFMNRVLTRKYLNN